MSIGGRQYEERWLTSITAPLIDLPHCGILVDVINAHLSGLVLLVSTETVDFMLSANVYGCPKMHEFIDVCQIANY